MRPTAILQTLKQVIDDTLAAVDSMTNSSSPSSNTSNVTCQQVRIILALAQRAELLLKVIKVPPQVTARQDHGGMKYPRST